VSETGKPAFNPLLRIHPRWTAVVCWIVLAAIMLSNYRDSIATMALYDSDDALRLVQVRDLIAGQSWFDTTQYRINPPTGGMMHWSRLIDLPIALGIRFLMLFVEQPVAERFVLALYPMALLGLLFACVKTWLAAYGSRPLTHVGLVVLATTATMIFQFAPLRIDHHSWQAILAVVVALFATAKPSVRNGAFAGLAMANYLGISIEGAAFMILFGAIFAFDWLLQREHGGRFIAYVAATALASAAILAITRGPWTLGQSYCDALSRPYLAALFALAAAAIGARAVIGDATPLRRVAILAIGGIAGVAAFAWADAACLNGPFEALDGEVRVMWYQNIKEGLPIWRQTTVRQLHLVILPVMALIGMAWAWRDAARAGDTAAVLRWRTSVFALVGATIVAALVFRTISMAHLFALPGIAWLIVTLGGRARRIGSPLPRIAATLAVLALTPLFVHTLASDAAAAIKHKRPASAGSVPSGTTVSRVRQCLGGTSLDQLRATPPALMFAPLDISPFLLSYSPHSVVATGHHRNVEAMAEVIDGFILDPDKARPIIEASGARYVAVCPRAPEYFNFRLRNSKGLASRLYDGDVPDWLQAITAPRGSEIRLYRVRYPGGRGRR